MAHTKWIYADGSGTNHSIGLYHGDRDGHVAIYCNKKIIQIDFSVKKSTVYSFFIEDEFCEIHLTKLNNGIFDYKFQVNTVVNTQKNRDRKRQKRTENTQLAVFGVALLCFVFTLLYFHHFQKEQKLIAANASYVFSNNLTQDQISALHQTGEYSVAHFYVTTPETNAVYAFQTKQHKQISGKLNLNNTSPPMLPNGFQLNDKDEFEVIYLPQNPLVHQINFNAPQPSTIYSYINTAIETERITNPDKNQCACLVEIVYQEKGWMSLSLIHHQNASPTAKKRYNQLINTPEILRKLQEKCYLSSNKN